MIYELRACTLIPGKLNEFLNLTREVGFAIAIKHSKCFGYWTSDVADMREQAARDSVWTDMLTTLLPFMQEMSNKVLVPTDFSPMK